MGSHIVREARLAGSEALKVSSRSGEDVWQADIRDEKQVARLISDTQPAAVINAAAISNIDEAEKKPDDAYAVNSTGAANVAKACAGKGIPYLFVSTDAVFSGEDPSYSEDSNTAPVNTYGRTKVEAERAVRDTLPDAVIVRISQVLGYPVGQGASFFTKLEQKLASGDTVSAPTFEYRTPIDVVTLSRAVIELVTTQKGTIFHLGTLEPASRYEITARVVEALGYSRELVEPRTTQPDDPERAPRHRNGILNVDKATRALSVPMVSLNETVTQAVQTRHNWGESK